MIPQQPTFAASTPLTYQTVADPATLLAYTQQLQQPQAYLHAYHPNTAYQSQLAQLLALRQAQLAQAQQGQLQAVQPEQVNFILKKMKTGNFLNKCRMVLITTSHYLFFVHLNC